MWLKDPTANVVIEWPLSLPVHYVPNILRVSYLLVGIFAYFHFPIFPCLAPFHHSVWSQMPRSLRGLPIYSGLSRHTAFQHPVFSLNLSTLFFSLISVILLLKVPPDGHVQANEDLSCLLLLTTRLMQSEYPGCEWEGAGIAIGTNGFALNSLHCQRVWWLLHLYLQLDASSLCCNSFLVRDHFQLKST